MKRHLGLQYIIQSINLKVVENRLKTIKDKSNIEKSRDCNLEVEFGVKKKCLPHLKFKSSRLIWVWQLSGISNMGIFHCLSNNYNSLF